MEELRLTKELRTLTIDPEFRDLIPPLSEEEHTLLEDSIVANGCESPLFIWRDIIVDGHNRYEICQSHSIPFAVIEKDFADRNAALMWIMQTQLGRRNLTSYQKGELVLRFEPLIRAQAKGRQIRKSVDSQSVPQKSAEQKSIRESRYRVAKLAGVSHDTIKKVKKLIESADDDTKQMLRLGTLSINGAYIDLIRKEHEGQLKACERCNQEKPLTEFNIPSNRHGFSALCKQCETEIKRAAKAASEAAAQTTKPVETQPVPSMVMHKGAPIHVATPLPDEPSMFEHIIDLVKFAGDGFIANISTAMRLYTIGMASDANSEVLIELMNRIAAQAKQIVKNKLKELDIK